MNPTPATVSESFPKSNLPRLLAAALLWCASGLLLPAGRAAQLSSIQTVFVILLENHDWSSFKNSPSAPYLNGTLLPQASYCEQYVQIPGLRPSLANYLWLEAGTNFGIFNNDDPSVNHLATTNHLAAQLRAAGISWRSYQEDIPGTSVPLQYINLYAPRHNPFVYFDDLTGTNNPHDAYGIAHNRPLSELAADLTNRTVARYNFITPNICNGGHDSCAPDYDPVRQTDNWLAAHVPPILASAAYQNGGAIFITWDESGTGDVPIGMVVLSPLARGGGYWNSTFYNHSSYVRTMQEIFGVRPWLANAANASSLADLFCRYSLTPVAHRSSGAVDLLATGVVPNRTNVVEASFNLAGWTPLFTNAVPTNRFTFTDTGATNTARFYRLREVR